ncbi:unnamed protein product, partial [Didymodactylos carnosus]
RKLMEPLKDVRNVTGFGHVGDGNLHLNVTTKEYSQTVKDVLEPFLYEWVSKQRGSISAEHGLGLHKAKYLGLGKSLHALDIMRNIKTLFDPNLILNPYKLFPYK